MAIPKKVKDQLLVESQHRCTICSERCFEIHHIIEQSEGDSNDIENLIIMCPNCHQHRYHRCGEFTRDQLKLYKKNLKERSEVEKRLLQNLEDIRKISKEKIHISTFERGVEEETLSCGTGATACAILANKLKNVTSPVNVDVPGGELTIEFDENFTNIWLSGPVEEIYTGVFSIH